MRAGRMSVFVRVNVIAVSMRVLVMILSGGSDRPQRCAKIERAEKNQHQCHAKLETHS